MFQVSLGRSITDAWLIILQIVLIQSINYFLLVLLCVVFCLPFGFVPTLEQLFSYKAISVFSLFGWINIVIWLLDGFIGFVLGYHHDDAIINCNIYFVRYLLLIVIIISNLQIMNYCHHTPFLPNWYISHPAEDFSYLWW